MNPGLTALIAVLVFSFLILIHELGHFVTARIFKVTVNEFSIGMGPRLLSRVSKKSGTRYSLAVLPIGGFVAMAGELEESEDPNAFDKKPAWQRFIITAAGATVNLIAGFIVVVILTSIVRIGGTTVTGFADPEKNGYDVSTEGVLEVGDVIVAVNGRRVRIFDELSYELMRNGIEPLDFTVVRNGETIVIRDVVIPTVEENGETFGVRDFLIYETEKSFGTVLSYSFSKSVLIVRMCWESIIDLITGRYSLAAVSGPVGISSALGEAASKGTASFLYMFALISINLGVMNLMPIPALDGGRLLTTLIEMITKKRLPAKVEGIINAVGLVLLLGLSLVIMVKDVFQLII